MMVSSLLDKSTWVKTQYYDNTQQGHGIKTISHEDSFTNIHRDL